MSRDAYVVRASGAMYGPFPEQGDAKAWLKNHKDVVNWEIIELNFYSYWTGWSNAQTARVIGKVVATCCG